MTRKHYLISMLMGAIVLIFSYVVVKTILSESPLAAIIQIAHTGLWIYVAAKIRCEKG